MGAYLLIQNPRRVAIYDNASFQYSAAEVRKLTGCDLVINGGLYDMKTGKPSCHLRIGGKTVAAEDWSRPGFAWNTGTARLTMAEAREMAQWDNFIDCVELVHRGSAVVPSYPTAMGGIRGRTAWGCLPDGKLVACVIPDNDSQNKLTVEKLQAQLMDMGAYHAMMNDCGGSSQWAAAGAGEASPVGRRVRNYICFWGDVQIFHSIADFRAAASGGLTKTLYKVQLCAFGKKENADRFAKELQGKGFLTCIVSQGGLYKVQTGAFAKKTNAEALAKTLREQGYAACIVKG